MDKAKTVDGYTFPLTFVDTADYLYEAYYDNTGFWFKAVESGNEYRNDPKWDFNVFKQYISSGDWEIISQSIPEKQQDPQVTISQSEYDNLVEEINMLQELVAELSKEKQVEVFRPISEYTLDDWKQAKEESWVFRQRNGELTTVADIDDHPDAEYPIATSVWLMINGNECPNGTSSYDIVERIK